MYFFATVLPVGDLYVEKVLLFTHGEEALFILQGEEGQRYLCSKTSELTDVGIVSWVFVPIGKYDLISVVDGADYRNFFEKTSGYQVSYSEEMGLYVKEFPAEKIYAGMLPAYQVDISQIEHDESYMMGLKKEEKQQFHITEFYHASA